MKRFYHLVAALAMSATASTAYGSSLNGTVNADGWLIVEDFEAGSQATPYDIQGNTPQATLNVIADPKDASNKVLECTTSDYNAIIEIPVTLPAGKTIADYQSVAFDLYRFNGDEDYKEMYVLADKAQIKKTGYVNHAKPEEWTPKSYAIPQSVTTGNTFKLRIGVNSPKAHYAVDNIRLEEKSTWTTVADFQDGAAVNAFDTQGNTPAATVKVIADPKDASNSVAECTTTDYNAIIEIPVTLPAGKTIADFKAISFDFYRFSDDDNYKEMIVMIDGNGFVKTDYIEHAKTEEWTGKRYDIPATLTSGNSIRIRIGLNSSKAHYAIDNVSLLARSGAPVTPPVIEPSDFYESMNGKHNDNDELVVNDFQHHSLLEVALPMWNYKGYDNKGNALTAADPKDSRNIVAHMKGENDMNTIHEMEVTLPEGKTLADYSEIKFDLYRQENDVDYKKMYVQADDHKIHEDGDYVNQAPLGTWTEKSYPISKDNTVGNSFKLRLGVLNDKPDYLIDNVRLVKRETPTGIVNVDTEASMTVTSSNGGLTILTDSPTMVRIYTVDGRLIKDFLADGATHTSLANGLYIVATISQTVKMIVR